MQTVSYRLIGRHQCKATSAGLGAWYRWIGGGPGQTLDHCRAAAFAGGGGCSTTFFYYFNDGNCACSRSTLNCALPTSWTGAIGPMLYGPSSSYNALPNGPGCSGSTAILNAHECGIAAATLGFSRSVHSGSWSHAPRGCHVGHPSDNWRNTYFNHLSGATGRAHYMSICYQQFSGNTDQGTKVSHGFSPIDARYVRFYVKTWNSWPSMRAGIITSGITHHEHRASCFKP